MSVTRRPSIRSRLSASFVAFLIGFVLANIGLLAVPRPDTWVWVAMALVLMATGVLGVVFADTRSTIPWWAVVGTEIFVAFSLLPLVWVVSQATTPRGEDASTLLPTSVSTDAFWDVLRDDAVRSSAVTSLLIAGTATLLAMAVAVPAAYALVQRDVRGGRWWYLLFVIALVLPTFVLASPASEILFDLGVPRWRPAMVVPTLAIAVPFAVWLTVRVFRRAPWTLDEAIRAEGGTRRQRLRHFALPRLGLDLLLVAVLVFFFTAGDFALGAGLAPTEGVRPLPATLLALSSDVESGRLVAAAGLLWALPLVLVGAVFARRIVPLFGRP